MDEKKVYYKSELRIMWKMLQLHETQKLFADAVKKFKENHKSCLRKTLEVGVLDRIKTRKIR